MHTPHRFRLLITLLSLVIAGCGGGGESGGGSTSVDTPPIVLPTATPSPLYSECTSTVPIDAGDPAQPVITLLGAKVINHPLGTQYVDTWDYVTNYPLQLAAVFPVSGGYGSSSGCDLSQTPSWAFIGSSDATVPYQDMVVTVNSINDCNPKERARITVLDGLGHNDVELPIFGLSGLGQGMTRYNVYNQSIFDWLLQHRRP